MSTHISKGTKGELIGALRERYGVSSKLGKTKILDEFKALTGFHRKHAIRLLKSHSVKHEFKRCHGRRIYDEAVREALVVIWEAGDRICGKRLKAVLPALVDAMERHGHLQLDPEVRRCLLVASASTLDRLLQPIRKEAKPDKRKRPRPKKPSGNVRVRTFADWNDPPPGYLEIDFVEHNGGSTAGAYIHSLVAVDVCSGWIESVPLLARSQELVVEALEVIIRQLPFPVLGIDSDNDSAFINDTLLDYCQGKHIEFTRSRAYRKNDQAWIEQKNGAVIRRFVGHDRYTGIVAGQALVTLYQAARLYVNHFQPSFKLREKEKIAAKVRRYYDKPMTPCDRLLSHPAVPSDIKKSLELQGKSVDPLDLLHRIRQQQAGLAVLACRDTSAAGPGRESLEQFMRQLGELWRQGEVRATHRTSPKKAHYWRTRKDPFESVWPDILLWLHDKPDATAKELFERLQEEQPGRFPDVQLRTLQRRVRAWRHVMARGLVYAGLNAPDLSGEVTPIGLDRTPILR
ncbi:MAG: transposase family protein [Candidatus Aminicenantales bacterium]